MSQRIMYHGTNEERPREIHQVGYIHNPFVTSSLRLAKARASRRKGRASLVVLKLDITGLNLSRDPMYRRSSEDPLLGPTYQIKSPVPTSRVLEEIREQYDNEWFDTISAPMYDRMLEREST